MTGGHNHISWTPLPPPGIVLLSPLQAGTVHHTHIIRVFIRPAQSDGQPTSQAISAQKLTNTDVNSTNTLISQHKNQRSIVLVLGLHHDFQRKYGP